MRLELNSVRSKMLLPAAVAVAATIVATVVTLAISRRATRSLAQVTAADFPSLQLYQDVRRQLEQVHTELLVAAMGGDPDNVGVADGDRDEAIRIVRDDGPATIGKELAEKFRADIEGYYAVARADALGQAEAIKEAKAGHARPADDLKAAANAEAAAGLYNKLLGRIDTEAHAARELIEQRFGNVARWQLVSVLSGALILLGAGAATGALAWWLSGRTARPLRVLSELTTRIADDDLTPEVPVSTRDEVGVLADGFHRMVARLREIVSTLKKASEGRSPPSGWATPPGPRPPCSSARRAASPRRPPPPGSSSRPLPWPPTAPPPSWRWPGGPPGCCLDRLGTPATSPLAGNSIDDRRSR